MTNKEEIDTYAHDFNVICPYCGNERECEGEDLTWEESEECEVHCYECEKDFMQSVTFIQYSRESCTMENFLERLISNKERYIEEFKRQGVTEGQLTNRIEELSLLKKQLEDLNNDK